MVQYLGNTHPHNMYMAYSKNPHLPKVRRDAVRLVKYRGWSMRKVARHFGVEPSTISRWCKHPWANGWEELPTKSARPKSHPRALSKELVAKIIAARTEHNRCSEVVHEYLKRDGVVVSLSSVKRMLKRYHCLKERSKWQRKRKYLPRPEAQHPGDLVQFDTVHLGSGKAPGYVYTAIDVHSRYGFAWCVGTANAATSVRFFKKVQKKFPFALKTVQTDNGPEFGLFFTDALRRAEINHRHIHPRSPNENGHLERFNRTLQEETPAWGQGLSPSGVSKFLTHYNKKRLHMGLKFKTPQEMLKVLPRY
jgi:transposase InsO family protein